MKQFKGPGNILLVVAFLSIALLAVHKLADFSQRTESISYSTFVKKVENNQIQSVEITGSEVYGTYRGDGKSFETTVPLKIYQSLGITP